MAKIKYEVEHVDPDELTAQVQRGGIQGNTLVAVVPVNGSLALVWQKPGREQRG